MMTTSYLRCVAYLQFEGWKELALFGGEGRVFSVDPIWEENMGEIEEERKCKRKVEG
jgi:hypothetical protein